MSPIPQLSPTVFLPPRADGAAIDPSALPPVRLVADAPPSGAAFGEDDLISGVSLTFTCLPASLVTARARP